MSAAPRRGCLIVMEGGEGVGKTTNLAFVAEHLRAAGVSLVCSREPGGTALGEALRGLLLDPDRGAPCADAELLMMFAARAQHIAEVIEPALARGDWVLSDRFTDASFAYQGGGRGAPLARIAELERWVQGELRPDCVLLLDAPVELGMARAGRRGVLDRFERERAAFFERVREVYLQRAAQQPARYRLIDAAQPLREVQRALAARLDELLEAGDG